MEFILVFILLIAIGGGLSTSSSSSSSKGRKKETIVYNQPAPQQPTVIYQQPPPQNYYPPQAPPNYYPPQQQPQQQLPAAQPAPVVQTKSENSAAIRNFAVKSYDKIAKDNQKGNGQHLNSLILLLENEGIPKDESLLLIKKALRKSNGNAEVFGNEIENSL